MAESIFRAKVMKAGLAEEITIDSAGTGNWHIGENPDPRTIRVLAENNIHIFSRARQVRSQDFQVFDYIIAMDGANIRDLKNWQSSNHDKLSLMLEWSNPGSQAEVPDPYYGDMTEFNAVYELLDEATDKLLADIREKSQISRT